MTETCRRPGSAPRIADLGLLFLLALLWGSSFTFTKVAVETIPPVTMVAARVAIAALLLWLVVRLRGLRMPSAPGNWRAFTLQACFNSVLPFTLITWGQQTIDSGLAGILNATPPVFVLLLTALWTRHEPITAAKWFGVACGLLGVALIIGINALDGLGRHTLSELAVVAASLCYALAAIYGRRFSGLSPLLPAAGSMTCAAVFMIPLSLLTERPWSLSPSPEALAALACLAVFSTAGAMLIYFRILHTLGSIGTASNSYLRAGVSVVLGIVFLGEVLTWSAAVGLALIVVGVVAINRRINVASAPSPSSG